MRIFYFFFFLIISFHSFPQTLIDVIDLPTGTYWNSSYGMVYENSRYWISSGSSTGQGIFYAVNENGSITNTYTVMNYPGFQESQGLAFDGTNFWYVDRKTARCDIFKLDTNGNVLDS